MSEIWRHLKFDFRRYGWVAAPVLLIVYFSPYLGQGLLVLIVVPLLVMNHKTAGSQAWWLVRPLNRKRLWIAKVIGIVILCLGAIVAMSVEPVMQGVHPVFVAWCQLEALPPLVVACGLTAVLASLSPDLRRYFLVLPAILIAVACLAAVWLQLADFLANRNPGAPIVRWFPTEPQGELEDWFLIALLSAAGLFTAVWVQLRKRRTGRTITMAVLAILAPLYLGNVVTLTPLYNGILRLQGGPAVPGEIRPISGHISLMENNLVAEREERAPGNFSWRVRIPFKIHLDEELPPNVYLETQAGFRLSSVGGPNPVEGSASQPFVRWYFNHQAALVHAAGVEPVNPVFSGRENWALFELPNGTDFENWMDRPLAFSKHQDCRGAIMRTHFVGTLEFEKGATLIDGGERYRISYAKTRRGQKGLAVTRITLLEPRSRLNPARRRWGGGGGGWNAFVLWDSLTSEAHFAERGIILDTLPSGELQFVSGFPSLSERKFSAARLGDLKILVIRQEWIETRSIAIKPATFTVSLLPIESDK